MKFCTGKSKKEDNCIYMSVTVTWRGVDKTQNVADVIRTLRLKGYGVVSLVVMFRFFLPDWGESEAGSRARLTTAAVSLTHTAARKSGRSGFSGRALGSAGECMAFLPTPRPPRRREESLCIPGPKCCLLPNYAMEYDAFRFVMKVVGGGVKLYTLFTRT